MVWRFVQAVKNLSQVQCASLPWQHVKERWESKNLQRIGPCIVELWRLKEYRTFIEKLDSINERFSHVEIILHEKLDH